MVKTPTNVVSQEVIFRADLSDHWDELVGDSNKEELSEEREKRWISGFLVVHRVHHCVVVTEKCDCSTCPALPESLAETTKIQNSLM